MNRFVVDANVAAKWVLPAPNESHVNQAVALLEDYVSTKIEILVPDLFWVEVGNLLRNAARRGRCTPDHALNALDHVTAQDFHTVPAHFVVRSAFEIATKYNCTVYDCLYVALAEALQAEFVTADERLANALPSKYSITRLGEL